MVSKFTGRLVNKTGVEDEVIELYSINEDLDSFFNEFDLLDKFNEITGLNPIQASKELDRLYHLYVERSNKSKILGRVKEKYNLNHLLYTWGKLVCGCIKEAIEIKHTAIDKDVNNWRFEWLIDEIIN